MRARWRCRRLSSALCRGGGEGAGVAAPHMQGAGRQAVACAGEEVGLGQEGAKDRMSILRNTGFHDCVIYSLKMSHAECMDGPSVF